VLDDERRTLVGGLSKPPPRSTETTARLRRALDDAEHKVGNRKPASRRRTHPG
jgi:NTE family protein